MHQKSRLHHLPASRRSVCEIASAGMSAGAAFPLDRQAARKDGPRFGPQALPERAVLGSERLSPRKRPAMRPSSAGPALTCNRFPIIVDTRRKGSARFGKAFIYPRRMTRNPNSAAKAFRAFYTEREDGAYALSITRICCAAGWRPVGSCAGERRRRWNVFGGSALFGNQHHFVSVYDSGRRQGALFADAEKITCNVLRRLGVVCSRDKRF